MPEQQSQPSTQQADAAPQQQTQTTAPAPQPSPLDKVYTDFKIEADAAEFKPQSPQPQQQPQQTPQAPQVKVPDPFDPNFGAYQAQLASGLSVLNQALAQTKGELTNMQRQLAHERTEADIKSAVGVIVEKSGLEPDIAEVALQAKARQDPRFLKIWNNRSGNPEAYKAALNAVATEFQGKYTVKQDPQLVENQRAVQASRNAMATTQKQSDQDQWAGMTATERQAKVQQMIRGGSR